ncbi:MAG: aminotransferase class V-fold PLP-dependent enzyme, partial [Candidatus Paceibacteria bacterium]
MQNNYRDLFPIFENQPNLAYLDSAATTQMFGSVLEEMEKYYRDYRANVHRGLYALSVQATEAYERARERVASFLGAADASE